jgi:hypothetical protein
MLQNDRNETYMEHHEKTKHKNHGCQKKSGGIN